MLAVSLIALGTTAQAQQVEQPINEPTEFALCVGGSAALFAAAGATAATGGAGAALFVIAAICSIIAADDGR